MPCISYEFYTGDYAGSSIDFNDFPRLISKAQAYVDYYINHRAVPTQYEHVYRLACCAVAEQYQIIDAAQLAAQKSISNALQSGTDGELQSQSVGGWSKTYRSGGESAKQAGEAAQIAKSALASTVQQYLAGTGLLYRGRRCMYEHVSTCGDTL